MQSHNRAMGSIKRQKQVYEPFANGISYIGEVERVHVERTDSDMLATTSMKQDQNAHVGQPLT